MRRRGVAEPALSGPAALAHILLYMFAGMAAGVWLYDRVDAAWLIPFYGALLIAVALKNLCIHTEKQLPGLCSR